MALVPLGSSQHEQDEDGCHQYEDEHRRVLDALIARGIHHDAGEIAHAAPGIDQICRRVPAADSPRHLLAHAAVDEHQSGEQGGQGSHRDERVADDASPPSCFVFHHHGHLYAGD